MTRNIFLSFLGTRKYTPCNYRYKNGQKIDNVKFVQTALTLIFGGDFTDKDKAVIFLTQQAKETNWTKLREEVGKRNPTFTLTPVSIPEGHTEEEIWAIFEIVYSQLQDKDHVILDVTHAFRSIPMLGIVLLNYAKFLKDIHVDGIYYGAFEVLGRPDEVSTLPMEQRNAPIFNLTAFDQLQQWSAGADSFVSGGNPKKIAYLLRQWAKPLLSESKGENSLAQTTRNLASNLEKSYNQLSTVRGKEIHEGKSFRNAYREIQELTRSTPIPALPPLLQRLQEKFTGFLQNECLNGLKGARLCLDFQLVQQGITLLQETIVTHLAEITPKLNHLDKQHRELVSSALHIYVQSIPESQWNETACRNKALVLKILNCPKTRILGPLYRNLSKLRNDINHGGYIQPTKAERFEKQLSQYLDEAEAILAPESDSAEGNLP